MGMHGSHTGPSRIEGCSWPLGQIICGVLAGGGQFPLATRQRSRRPQRLAGSLPSSVEFRMLLLKIF